MPTLMNYQKLGKESACTLNSKKKYYFTAEAAKIINLRSEN